MNEKKGCPDKIFLQACDKCYAEASAYADSVTWCEDEIGHECEEADEKDVEYVRLSRLKEAVKEIKVIATFMGKGLTDFSEAEVDFVFDKYFPELNE